MPAIVNPAEAAAHLLNDAPNIKAMVVGYIDSEDQVTYFTSGGIMPCIGLADLLGSLMARKLEGILDEGEGLEDLDDDE